MHVCNHKKFLPWELNRFICLSTVTFIWKRWFSWVLPPSGDADYSSKHAYCHSSVYSWMCKNWWRVWKILSCIMQWIVPYSCLFQTWIWSSLWPPRPLRQFHILPLLGVPGLDTVLRMGSYEGDNPLPLPNGLPSFDAAYKTVGLLDNGCTLLAYVQLFIYQDPQILGMAALKEFFSRSVDCWLLFF